MVAVDARAPVPTRFTVCGLPLALSVIVMIPFREPLAVGVLHKPRRPAGTPRPESGEQPTPSDFEAGVKPDWITVPEVPGYVVQKIGPVEFAIKPEFAGLLTDLTKK